MFVRYRKWLCASGLALAVASVGGCGGGGRAVVSAADDAGRVWLSRGDAVLGDLSKSEYKIGSDVVVGDDALRIQVDDALRAAPAQEQIAQMSPELRAQIATVVARIRFQREVDQAIAAGIAANAALPGHASEIVERLPLLDDAKAYMRDHTADILREATCDFAWQQMLPDEQDDARAAIGNGTFATTYGDLIPNVVIAYAGEYVKAVMVAGRTWYLQRYVDPDVVDWANYGQSILDKAGELTSGGDQVMWGPDGVQLTRALIHFASICLKPPGA